MRAFQVTATGTAPVLREVPAPSPGPGESLIDIRACGLNFADLLMIDGSYQERHAPPFTLGMELAGVVAAIPQQDGTVAPDAGPAPGTRVAAFASFGGLAEAIALPHERLIPLPDSMPFDHAAGFLVAYGTSHLALAHRAALRPGETLAVLGAAGGVGLTAVEIGKRMGARVIACVRGTEKRAVAEAAGADVTLDTEAVDLRGALRAEGGVDVVYDAVGGAVGTAGAAALRPGGRFLIIGFAGGGHPSFAPNHMLVKNISVHGFYWSAYEKLDPAAWRQSLATLFQWYAKGGLKPHISHHVPLSRAAEGLELIRGRGATGKVVVTIPE